MDLQHNSFVDYTRIVSINQLYGKHSHNLFHNYIGLLEMSYDITAYLDVFNCFLLVISSELKQTNNALQIDSFMVCCHRCSRSNLSGVPELTIGGRGGGQDEPKFADSFLLLEIDLQNSEKTSFTGNPAK